MGERRIAGHGEGVAIGAGVAGGPKIGDGPAEGNRDRGAIGSLGVFPVCEAGRGRWGEAGRRRRGRVGATDTKRPWGQKRSQRGRRWVAIDQIGARNLPIASNRPIVSASAQRGNARPDKARGCANLKRIIINFQKKFFLKKNKGINKTGFQE